MRLDLSCILHTTGSMLILRICAGASAGKTILPTAASNVPAQLRERLSAHKQPFRVRGRYSRRACGNRGPRFGATVRTSETSALALRVLRATAQYSICDFGVFCAACGLWRLNEPLAFLVSSPACCPTRPNCSSPSVFKTPRRVDLHARVVDL